MRADTGKGDAKKDDKKKDDKAKEETRTRSRTQHTATIQGKEIKYTATAGKLVMKSYEGEPKAQMSSSLHEGWR